MKRSLNFLGSTTNKGFSSIRSVRMSMVGFVVCMLCAASPLNGAYNGNIDHSTEDHPQTIDAEPLEESPGSLPLAASKLSCLGVGSATNIVAVFNESWVFKYNSANAADASKGWEYIALDREMDIIDAAAGANGDIWVLNKDGEAYSYKPDGDTNWEIRTRRTWQGMSKISIGEDGTVWGISFTSGEHVLKSTGGTQWNRVYEVVNPADIAVVNANQAYKLGQDGNLYFKGNGANYWAPKAVDAGITLMTITFGDNVLWGLDATGDVLRYDPLNDTFDRPFDKKFTKISAAEDGTMWGIDACYTIWKLQDGAWVQFAQTGASKYAEESLILTGDGKTYASSAATSGGAAVTTFLEKLSEPAQAMSEVAIEDTTTKADLNAQGEALGTAIGVEVLFPVVATGVIVALVAYNTAFVAAAAVGTTVTAAGVAGSVGAALGPVVLITLAVAAAATAILAPIIIAGEDYFVNILVINDTDTRLTLDGEILVEHGSLIPVEDLEQGRANPSNIVIAPRSISGPSMSSFIYEKNWGMVGTEGVIRFSKDECTNFPGLAIGWGVPYRDDAAIDHKNKCFVELAPIRTNDVIYDEQIDVDLGSAIITSSTASSGYSTWAGMDKEDGKYPTMVVYVQKD